MADTTVDTPKSDWVVVRHDRRLIGFYREEVVSHHPDKFSAYAACYADQANAAWFVYYTVEERSF